MSTITDGECREHYHHQSSVDGGKTGYYLVAYPDTSYIMDEDSRKEMYLFWKGLARAYVRGDLWTPAIRALEMCIALEDAQDYIPTGDQIKAIAAGRGIWEIGEGNEDQSN